MAYMRLSLTFRCDGPLKRAVEERAVRENRTVSSLVEWFVKRGMAEDAAKPSVQWGSMMEERDGEVGRAGTPVDQPRDSRGVTGAEASDKPVRSSITAPFVRVGTVDRREVTPDPKRK